MEGTREVDENVGIARSSQLPQPDSLLSTTPTISSNPRGDQTTTSQHPPGPKMTAFQIMILSAFGAPEIPAGGSAWSRLKSLTRRLLAAVDCAPGEIEIKIRSVSDGQSQAMVLVKVSVGCLLMVGDAVVDLEE